MFYNKFQRPLTGIDIGKSSVKIVQILKGKKGWRLLGARTFAFPEDTLRLSMKTKNINDPQAFLETVREALSFFGKKVHRVGLSIPNESTRVMIQTYTGLPNSADQAEKMIGWLAKKSLPFPVDRTKIAHYTLAGRNGDRRTLLLALAFDDVIREYELNLQELKVEPELIRPAGINQLNFYSDRIPRSGTVGFMGLFDDFFTLFVCVHGTVFFYHGIKRGFSDIHFFQDVDMTLHLFRNEKPGRKIEKLFFGSQVGFEEPLEEGLRTLGKMAIVRMHEDELISIDGDGAGLMEGEIRSYASAIGAAQSLAQ